MIHHSLPNEVIRKIIKMNDNQVCLMLEATISKEVENEYQVEKHNKMEVYDFSQDREIAKKAVLKLEYKIDIDSSRQMTHAHRNMPAMWSFQDLIIWRTDQNLSTKAGFGRLVKDR